MGAYNSELHPRRVERFDPPSFRETNLTTETAMQKDQPRPVSQPGIIVEDEH